MILTYETGELKHHGILGMKWGVRRYQNKDGTLTDAGKKRYDRDIRENAAKKKENRIDVSSPDPHRWVREDTERTKRSVDAASDLNKKLSKIEQDTRPKAKKKKMDLSNMTDKEMRDKINRKILEEQYTNMFGEDEAPKVSKGREYVKETLEIGGSALAVASSALAIALAIRDLRG